MSNSHWLRGGGGGRGEGEHVRGGGACAPLYPPSHTHALSLVSATDVKHKLHIG